MENPLFYSMISFSCPHLVIPILTGEEQDGIKINQKMKRISLLFSLGIFFLGACGERKEPPPTLSLFVWGDRNELIPLRKSISDFSSLYPIKVEVIWVGRKEDYQLKLQTMMMTGNPPDVMHIENSDFPLFAEKGIFLSLDELVGKNKKIDIFPLLFKPFSYQKKLYALPKDFSTLILYFNGSLFQKKGIPSPRGWSWDSFLEASYLLTFKVKGGGSWYGFELSPAISSWIIFAWQNGGEILGGGEVLLDLPPYREKNAEALDFYSFLLHRYRVAGIGQGELFKKGKAGMVLGRRELILEYKRVKGFKWDISPPPKGRKKSTLLFVTGYSISRLTPYPEESKKLVEFLIQPPYEIEIARSGKAIPSRSSVALSSHFLKTPQLPPGVNNRANLEVLVFARPFPSSPCWRAFHSILEEEIGKRILVPKKSLREGITCAGERMRNFIKIYQ